MSGSMKNYLSYYKRRLKSSFFTKEVTRLRAHKRAVADSRFHAVLNFHHNDLQTVPS
jgi:hypothetical protein